MRVKGGGSLSCAAHAMPTDSYHMACAVATTLQQQQSSLPSAEIAGSSGTSSPSTSTTKQSLVAAAEAANEAREMLEQVGPALWVCLYGAFEDNRS